MFTVHLNDGEKEFPKDDIFYVIGQNGIHLRKKVGLIDSLAPVDRISILKPVDTYASMDIKPMPIRIVAHVLGFFRKVYEEYRSEAVIILHYNEKNGNYKIEVPPQKVGAGSAEYVGAQKYQGYTRIGTIHSHAAMGAFHSGTDNHDEEHFDGLHITFGNMGTTEFSISASIVSNGMRIIIEPEDYLDGVSLKEEVQHGTVNGKPYTYTTNTNYTKRYLFSKEELGETFPKAWFKRVESTRTVYHQPYAYGGTYGRGAAGQGNGNRHFPPGFNMGGYARRGGSRVFTPGGANEPGVRRPFQHSFRSEDYVLDPCESCAFKDCEGATGGQNFSGMDTDDVLRYMFENFDEDEIVDLGIQMVNLERPDEDLTELLTMEVGSETSGIEIGLDEIPPSMIKDGE